MIRGPRAVDYTQHEQGKGKIVRGFGSVNVQLFTIRHQLHHKSNLTKLLYALFGLQHEQRGERVTEF